jgi:hypothetical protein
MIAASGVPGNGALCAAELQCLIQPDPLIRDPLEPFVNVNPPGGGSRAQSFCITFGGPQPTMISTTSLSLAAKLALMSSGNPSNL